MAIITYPLNNIEYTAEDAELYHATRTSGVFANDDFPITVSGDGNVVTIGEGIGWIRNSKFSGKVVANKAEMSLDLGLPHATYPRIDAIVLRFSANANASEIIVKNGTAKTNPTPPEVIRTESVYELHLYHVYRGAGAASITSSNVTDLRSDASYCGIMSDDVTMLGDDYVLKNTVGVANGVASLDGNGKVPGAQLPSMNYIPVSEKGAANGVASLGSNGKVPSVQLPAMDYIPTSQKGSASGVASLGIDGKVPNGQLGVYENIASVQFSGALSDGSYPQVVRWHRVGNIVFVSCDLSVAMSGNSNSAGISFTGLPEMTFPGSASFCFPHEGLALSARLVSYSTSTGADVELNTSSNFPQYNDVDIYGSFWYYTRK